MFFGPPMGGGGGPPFAANFGVPFWNEWAQVSPYSPCNLRHLRQPVPKDLPAGVDAKAFGFEDAFEDLMAVSAGRQMMDLSRQARMKKDIIDHFGFSEPPINWVRRLGSDGLLPRPLPPSRRSFGPGWTDRDDPREVRRLFWEEQMKNDREFNQLWESSMRETDRTMSKPEGSDNSLFREWEKFKESGGNDPFTFAGQYFGKAREKAKETAKNLEEQVKREADEWAKTTNESSQQKQQQKQQQEQQPQPSSETDLFNLVWSTVAQADRTFNNFANSLMDMSRPVDQHRPTTTTPQDQQQIATNGNKKTTTTTEENAFGGKTVRTTSEWVDPTGYLHSNVEVVKYDANGRVVSSEETSQVSYARTHQWTYPRDGVNANAEVSTSMSTSASVSQSEHDASSKPDDGKSTGWFWR